MNLAIIGCGKLGSSYATTLLRNQFVNKSNLVLCEQDPARISFLKAQVDVESGPIDARVSSVDVILLCVKPQDFGSCAKLLREFVNPKQIVISVMAGVRLSCVGSELGGIDQIIRCMPNLGVQIGKAITPYYAASSLLPHLEELACKLFNATGEYFKLTSEEQIDSVTAISGNGPAYVFYFLETLINCGLDLGFSQDEAEKLAVMTFEASIDIYKGSGKSLPELRQAICTPNGTSAAAFAVLGKGDWKEILNQSVRAGLRRSREIGSRLSKT